MTLRILAINVLSSLYRSIPSSTIFVCHNPNMSLFTSAKLEIFLACWISCLKLIFLCCLSNRCQFWFYSFHLFFEFFNFLIRMVSELLFLSSKSTISFKFSFLHILYLDAANCTNTKKNCPHNSCLCERNAYHVGFAVTSRCFSLRRHIPVHKATYYFFDYSLNYKPFIYFIMNYAHLNNMV